jgi:type II secretory pathway component PulJ
MQRLNSKIFRRSAGMSLVSLMIGMLISMLGVLAGFMLYQNMVKVTLQSRADAAQDGQLASAMLSLQLDLQAAGFGIDRATYPGPHLIVTNGAPQTIYWRYLETSTDPDEPKCKAFQVNDNSDGDARKLELLEPKTAASCTLDAPLATLVGGWNVSNTLAEFKKTDATKVGSLPQVVMSLTTTKCFPYGLGTADNYKTVTISVDGAARRAAIDSGNAAPAIAPSIYNFCIPNIP